MQESVRGAVVTCRLRRCSSKERQLFGETPLFTGEAAGGHNNKNGCGGSRLTAAHCGMATLIKKICGVQQRTV